MLAPNELKPIAAYVSPIAPIPDVEYSGFPWWFVMLVEPNRERLSAERLKRVNVHVFLPMFSKRIRRRAGQCGRRDYAVMPGMMFVPIEFMDIPNRNAVMDWAHVRGFVRGAGTMAQISKANIEIIREIEAKLNTEEAGGVPAANGARLHVGTTVRFMNDVYSSFFGDATVIEVVSKTRIGVEVSQLFGGRRTIVVPASEIEVM